MCWLTSFLFSFITKRCSISLLVSVASPKANTFLHPPHSICVLPSLYIFIQPTSSANSSHHISLSNQSNFATEPREPTPSAVHRHPPLALSSTFYQFPQSTTATISAHLLAVSMAQTRQPKFAELRYGFMVYPRDILRPLFSLLRKDTIHMIVMKVAGSALPAELTDEIEGFYFRSEETERDVHGGRELGRLLNLKVFENEEDKDHIATRMLVKFTEFLVCLPS
ncbi:hypothetical protein K402DRAFT_12724 [Aulographum hederae CBS 113979]|uniref:Uncharacterized protein n=1 Tax=Aulographum hederae CBS 113979 TaxID=1176131 RepID=A0A6G1H7I0_9PEZI|nr:hypothetical protein K402DRAFT_12724 [Aulographum hederae CBS 113979]